jgi:hypothetical protein
VSSCSWQGALTCPVCGCSGESTLGAVEVAMAEAEKHEDRSELLAALVAEAKAVIEQAKTQQAERARAAAEEAEVAAAVKAEAEAERARVAAEAAEAAEVVKAAEAVERLQLEERLAALALEVQQVQAQLGSSVVPPAAPQDEETLCVLCMDAPKDHMIAPCGHQCVCEACAEKLKKARHALCPFCRTPINATFKVFVV